nr:WPE palindromic element domain-containing protein [Wolbachia endosymbiont (group A) of Volucella inflata]
MPRHWDPEDLISTKWLHNKGWIPVSGHWNDSNPTSYRHGISRSR